jgi:hypothetical protein
MEDALCAHIFLILLAFVQTDAAARRSLYTENSPSCFYLDMSRHEFTISSSLDCISIAQVNINCFQIDYICTRFLYASRREELPRVMYAFVPSTEGCGIHFLCIKKFALGNIRSVSHLMKNMCADKHS